ncbi:MAG TPA: hypothetical protein EYN66_23605 [Myxococcales bacterium]|nr:hypothetical protein [Myxococcales bacterium]
MVHKPKHKVHSFRGLLADGGQDEINLERQNVNLAYRIIKFEVIPNIPDNANCECTVQIYKNAPSSIVGTIDFTDTDVLAAIFYNQDPSPANNITQAKIIDSGIFSRNIYVTNVDGNASTAINYYIELEEVPVTASTLMQLKLGVARKLSLTQ